MQYDSIILELMNRIKTLEARCDEMENQIGMMKPDTSKAFIPEIKNKTSYISANEDNKRQKMTQEMIHACYEYGVILYQQNNADFGQEVDKLTFKTGMNRNSAIMYVYAVKSMLQGKIYKRAISQIATEQFFQNIFKDFGKEGLQKAVRATKAHIVYRRQCGLDADGLDNLCDHYEELIK